MSGAVQGARARAAGRFRRDRHLFFYSHAKIALDPSYRYVAEALAGSQMPLLDVGCGAGLLAAYLRERGEEFAIRGLDADGRKIGIARECVGDEKTVFEAGDARELPAHCGNVVVLDVIHYFAEDEQKRFLAEVAGRVAPGGAAYVRLTVRDDSWRFRLTQWEEWFVSGSGWIPFRGQYFPTRGSLESALAGQDMACRIFPMWGVTPFNSHMLEMRRGL